jgi:glycosyltransferase involved in cell wall biosynthesis
VNIGGLLGHRELQSRMLEAHVLVLLSDYEGLPIALMEAMAGGLVPVCFKIQSGIPELVEDEVTGLLVADRGDGFIAALRRLRDEEGLWPRLSEGARGQIAGDYSLDVSTRRWKTLFENLQSAAPPRRGEALQVPRKLRLPDRHPDIDPSEDPRWPGYLGYKFQRVKRLLRP